MPNNIWHPLPPQNGLANPNTLPPQAPATTTSNPTVAQDTGFWSNLGNGIRNFFGMPAEPNIPTPGMDAMTAGEQTYLLPGMGNAVTAGERNPSPGMDALTAGERTYLLPGLGNALPAGDRNSLSPGMDAMTAGEQTYLLPGMGNAVTAGERSNPSPGMDALTTGERAFGAQMQASLQTMSTECQRILRNVESRRTPDNVGMVLDVTNRINQSCMTLASAMQRAIERLSPANNADQADQPISAGACGDSPYPQCGGTCPASQRCAAKLSGCECERDPNYTY